MQIPDIINGTFEMCGGLFILNHCLALYKDKMVKGVSIISTIFFMSWGIWNLYFYPHLEQMWSFYGGLIIMTTNFIWICMMIYYKYRKQNAV
jgi:hypothetical protein